MATRPVRPPREPPPEEDGEKRTEIYARYRRDLSPTFERRRRETNLAVWFVRIAVVVIGGSVAGLVWWARSPVPRQIDRRPIDVSREPTQENLAGAAPIAWTSTDERVNLIPLARYRIAGRVVGTERYRHGWKGELVPWDVALAWGKMADPTVLDRIHFTQSDRWVHYVYGGDIPVDAGYLVSHVSNNHWIPAGKNLERALARLGEGDLIEAEGLLVRAERGRGGDWTSSLVRDDSGDGSCELMYLQKLRVGPRVYE